MISSAKVLLFFIQLISALSFGFFIYELYLDYGIKPNKHPYILAFTLENPTLNFISFQKFSTPFVSSYSLFEVKYEEEIIPFRGPHVNFAMGYLSLIAPFQTRKVYFNLALFYNLTRPGFYTVQYPGTGYGIEQCLLKTSLGHGDYWNGTYISRWWDYVPHVELLEGCMDPSNIYTFEITNDDIPDPPSIPYLSKM